MRTGGSRPALRRPGCSCANQTKQSDSHSPDSEARLCWRALAAHPLPTHLPRQRPRPLPLTAPARCRGEGSGGRSPLRGCPSRLPGGCLPWLSTRCAIRGAPGDPHSVRERPAWPPWPRPPETELRGSRGSSPTRGKTAGNGEPREGRGRVAAGPLLQHPWPAARATRTVVTGNIRGRTPPTAQVRDGWDAGLRGAPVPSHRPQGEGDDPMGSGPCRDAFPPTPSHTHLAPGAGPGRLPGLGGLPERKVIGGPLLT